MTKEQLIENAEKMARKYADRLVEKYVAGVTKYADDYITDGNDADDDDFFAWVEGYDWS